MNKKDNNDEHVKLDDELMDDDEDDFNDDDMFDDVPEELENDYANDDEMPVSNALELAHQTIKPSDVAKQFKEMPKEVKIGFLTDKMGQNILHLAKTYRNYQYIKKNFELQGYEDETINANRKKLYSVNSNAELKEYFELNNKRYLYNMLIECGHEDKLLSYVQSLTASGFEEDIENINVSTKQIFAKYKEAHAREDYIDDIGMMGSIVSEAVVSSGLHGNERNAGISAISVNKDVNLLKDAEEKPTMFNRMKKAMNRFN